MAGAAEDRIAELANALRALAELRQHDARGGLRREIDSWAESALASARPLLQRRAGPVPAGVSEVELERAFEAAEPDLAHMITPDSIAEEAALFADGAADEHSTVASTGAFATRTMADLLERQGDRRGAARIRAQLGDVAAADRPAREDATVIAALERWLVNARRAQT